MGTGVCECMGMESAAPDFLATRRSLLTRLGNLDDNKSWECFLDTYGGLIYAFAVKAGLGAADAQDVLQETLIAVAKQMPDFNYDPAAGSFKGWLLQITRRRIVDHWRKANVAASLDVNQAAEAESEFEKLWDAEWRQNLLTAATERLRSQLKPKQFQIFDLYVVQGWPLEKICSTLRGSEVSRISG